METTNPQAESTNQTRKPASGGRVAERVTVNLAQRSALALDEVTDLTGDTKTEVINKALQLYSLVQAAQQRGGGLWIQDEPGSAQERVRFY